MVPRQPEHAFTLTELLVVIAMLVLMAMVVLPALAGAQNKGGRMQCANNLRQIGVASMIYATEYRDWLPIDLVHPSSVNVLNAIHYTAYVAFGPANTFVPTNAVDTSFMDLGLLYHVSLAGNGSIFYCPEQWGTAYGANTYSPLLTTDLYGGGGAVRSSYFFNPRITDPANSYGLPYNMSHLRLYQKTGDLPPHKLFVVDHFLSKSSGHIRECGWNVLFTDGSVQFSRNDQAYNLIQNFVSTETTSSWVQADQIFNCLEFDH